MTRARELADNSQGTKPKVIDAKGDLIAGTAADTAAKVTVGANGTFLKANSSQTAGVEWATVDALPSQTSNTGKYLTTDGSTASWASVTTDPTADIFMMMGA
jgi:hypothetical protein